MKKQLKTEIVKEMEQILPKNSTEYTKLTLFIKNTGFYIGKNEFI